MKAPMKGWARTLGVGLLLALLMPLATSEASVARTLTSGQLEAQQNEQFVCTLINKGTSDVTAMLSLKTPGGTLLGPSATPTIAAGQSASLVYTVPFGPVLSTYCHAMVPTDSTVFGNLRVNDQLMATRSSSQLQSDVNGKLDGILGELEALGPSGAGRSATRSSAAGTRARCGLGFELAVVLAGLLGRRRYRT